MFFISFILILILFLHFHSLLWVSCAVHEGYDSDYDCIRQMSTTGTRDTRDTRGTRGTRGTTGTTGDGYRGRKEKVVVSVQGSGDSVWLL